MESKSLQVLDTLPKQFMDKVKRYGNDKVAVRQKELGIWQEFTWQDSFEQVRDICLGLVSMGLRRGERVCIIGDNDRQHIWADLAIMSAGAATVGIFTDAIPSGANYISGSGGTQVGDEVNWTVASLDPGISVTVLGLSWIGLALAHAVLLRDLPHGDGIVIDVLVGTFIGDTGAYLGGRAFGRRPLAPSISPNKTVEGLAIGIVCGVAAVWFAGLYQDWLSGTDALILGVAVALAAPLGDLFESYLKRDAGTKDTGRLFGAHGGALDRLGS